jgi:hypothetical protein
VGGTCDTHGGGEKSVQDFGGKTQRKETIRKNKAQMGEVRKVYKSLVGKTKEKKPLGRTRRR